MRFRELRIEASDTISDRGVVPPNLVFRWTAHHVREIFTALMPRGFVLDGSSLVQITCGPRGNEPKYDQVLGSSNYFVEDFNFTEYAKASTVDRQTCLLGTVEAALSDIANQVGADVTVITTTAQAVRDNSFRLEREVPKLRMRLPVSGHTVRIFRCLSAEHGETWFLRNFDKKGVLLREEVMGKSPDYLDRRDFYRSAAVEGTRYLVQSRLGKETYCFKEA